jgi:fluoroquinolone resistance protein
MADRLHGVPPPPTTSTVWSSDFDVAGLSGRRHDAVNFINVDLSDEEERGAVFNDCTFRGSLFNASTHRDAAFINCTFVMCSFFDSRFAGCKLVGSMFDQCTFGPLEVEGGDWSFVGMPGADLRQATFRKLTMREADLTGARFDGAIVRDVDLSGALLHKASFNGADLRGSDLSAFDPLTVDLADATIDLEQAAVIAVAFGLRIG